MSLNLTRSVDFLPTGLATLPTSSLAFYIYHHFTEQNQLTPFTFFILVSVNDSDVLKHYHLLLYYLSFLCRVWQAQQMVRYGISIGQILMKWKLSELLEATKHK